VNNKNLIHWWELPKTTHICLSQQFRLRLKNKRRELKYSQLKLAKLIGVKETSVRSWERNQRRPDKEDLLKLLKELKISRESIYGHILFIRGEGKGKKIEDPQLPYEEKPEHIQIMSHGFFDGTLGHATENCNGSLIYQSANDIEQELFKNLIEKSNFGTFKLLKDKRHQYSLPSVLTKLLMGHYNINTLSSRKAKFSDYVIKKFKNFEWKRLVLKAAYIDEGSCGKKLVRDNLTIFSSVNQMLIKQISEVLRSLDYKFSINRGKTVYSLNLYAISLQKFYKYIISTLPNGYYKRNNAGILLKRQERETNINKQLNKIEKIIIERNQIKVIEVQKLLNIHEASARRRLKRLINLNKLIKKGRGKYEINKEHQFTPCGIDRRWKQAFCEKTNDEAIYGA